MQRTEDRLKPTLLAGIQTMAALIACVLVASQARAQNSYKQLPLGISNERPVQTWPQLGLAPEGKPIPEMISGAQPLNLEVFDKFFNEYMFPLFSRSEDIKGPAGKMYSPLDDGPAGITSPSRMRYLFKTNYSTKATNPAVRQHLNEITLRKMEEIASDNYHPVCRANAMMMLADLNDSEPNKPYKKALPSLMKALTAQNSIDAVRVPALRGLLRQAQGGLDGDTRGQVIAAMLALQAQRTPPADRNQDGQDWICRRAIDVLTAIGDAGQNASVLNALMKTVDDPAASVAVRCAAAGAMGSISYAPPQGFNAEKWIKSLGTLAVDSYKNELANAAANNTPVVADRLKQQLTEIRVGLAGPDGTKGLILLSAAAKPNQDLARLLVNQIDNLIAKCATPPAPATPPVVANVSSPTGSTDYIALPPDPQKPLIDAIQKAGDEVQAAVQRGPGAAPAAPADAGALGGAPAAQNPF